MCGIAGIYNFNGAMPDFQTLKRMADIIKHRGPDDEGYYVQENVALAHRRLSIIDLKTGKQPIFNEDRSIVIVYNGEIYNYKNIRQHLLKKEHHFYTETDTEVIVHAYEEWGNNCLNHFNGMFAFALWDNQKKELFLARDRLGIKPLYYYFNKNKIIFASEIKAILQDSDVISQLNDEALIDFITFQNILDDKTFFKDIYKLLPGHFIVCKLNGAVNICQYWDLSFSTDTNSDNVRDCLEQYEHIFHKSIKRHLISDVPVGSYLSGGFDSTSVAYLASKEVKNTFYTFTGAFTEGSDYDERECARAVAQKIGAKNLEVIITPQDYRDSILQIMYHLDEPTLGSGAFPQFMVAKLVSEHVRVVLTGHGGDELFCGYEVYKAAHIREIIKNKKIDIFNLISMFNSKEFLRIMYFLIGPLFCKDLRYGLFIMFNNRQRTKLFTQDFLKNHQNYSPIEVVKKILYGKAFSFPEMFCYLYVKTYLPTLFIQEDKVSMAHSIEARTPICDNEMVNFAVSLPFEYKLHQGILKYFTKSIMKGKLPDILYNQKKMGFPTPIARWYRNELKDFAYESLLSPQITKRNIFNIKYLKNMLNNHCSRKTETLYDYAFANRIYSLIAIEYWFRSFIDNEYRLC